MSIQDKNENIDDMDKVDRNIESDDLDFIEIIEDDEALEGEISEGTEELQNEKSDDDNEASETESSRIDKKTKKKTGKSKKPISKFFFVGLVFAIVNLVIAGIVGYNVKKLLPTKYMVLFVVVIIAVNALLVFASRRIWSGIIMVLISGAISAVMLYGLDVLSSVEKAIDNITLDNEEPQVITEMGIVVLSDSNIHQITDLSEFVIGYIKDCDYEHTQKLMTEINSSIGGTANYIEFVNTASMAEALYAKTIDAIIMNTAYMEIIAELEGYEEFMNMTKVVYSSEIVTYIEFVEKHETNLDAFVVYISGMDKFGHIGAKTRSDVNILAVVNTKTRHIQLINTPRDYYVPHSVSNGQPDKLTHAGLYGVNSSIYALENLYGINIDFYVRMNFSGFEGVIDALGGIDVYSEYDFTVEPIKHYTVGMNHLTGLEALAFARERKSFAAGDIQRGKHQMEVIKATVNKMTSVEMLSKYGTVLEELSWCFQTNMSSDEIYTLVRGQLASSKSWKFDNYTVTGTGSKQITYSMPGTELYVMLPNEKKVKEAKELIEAVLNEK